jgi:hypothetical protein
VRLGNSRKESHARWPDAPCGVAFILFTRVVSPLSRYLRWSGWIYRESIHQIVQGQQELCTVLLVARNEYNFETNELVTVKCLHKIWKYIGP